MTAPSVAQADQLARAVLSRRLKVRPKENVLIEAFPSSLPWATAFVREARRLGARPLFHYEDEQSYWRAVEEGRANLIGSPGENEWAALAATDVYIFFWGPEDLARRGRLPEKVREQLTAFNGKWYDVAHKAGLRGARMGIARVTEANARFWNVPFRAWQREVLEASKFDPARMRPAAERVRRALETGRELRIRHPNGTDLTLGLAGRRANTTLGEITPEGRKTRFGSMVNVPDGTVYAAVDEEMADGEFVANLPTTFTGYCLRSGKFRFRDGRLRGFTAGPGSGEALRTYRAAGGGRDRPSFIEVGLNPALRRAPGLEEAVGGAITTGIGGNAGFGGKTKLDFVAYLTLAGAEMLVDSRPLVRGGKVVGG